MTNTSSSKVETKLSGTLDVPIVQSLYHLYKTLHELLLKFPKAQRFTLGATLQTHLTSAIEAVVTAASTSEPGVKKDQLRIASAKLDLLRLLTRLAKDTKCVSNPAYLELESQLHESGRMLGGWLKSL